MPASSARSGPSHSPKRSRSVGPSSTTNELGTRTRPCPTICFLSAASRCRAAATSTGWTTPPKTRAKAPSTRPSSRRSKRWSTPTPVPLPCGRRSYPGARQDPGLRRAGANLLVALGRVAEWQTRTVQVRVSERTWGFNSPLAHSKGEGLPDPGSPSSFRDRVPSGGAAGLLHEGRGVVVRADAGEPVLVALDHRDAAVGERRAAAQRPGRRPLQGRAG